MMRISSSAISLLSGTEGTQITYTGDIISPSPGGVKVLVIDVVLILLTAA
jgi:hypothetical protein